MKSLNLRHLDLSTMPSKALILSTAAILAACSRNPEPAVDETGRADTTMISDSAYRARVDSGYRTPSDTAIAPLPNASGGDSIGVGRDTSNVRQMPSNDSSKVSSDSGKVSHDAQRQEGDSAMVNHNVPDSTGKSDSLPGR